MTYTPTYKITTISLPIDPESQQTITDFKVLCVCDGWSFSKGVMEAIKEYVKKHKKGNPQQNLGTFNDPEAKAYVAPRGCGFCHADAVKVVLYKPKNALVPLCLNHYRVLIRSPNYEKTELEVSRVEAPE